MKLPEPFNLDEEEYLAGKDGILDIDPIFAKSLEQVLDEFTRFAPRDIEPDDERAGQPSLFCTGYTFQDVPAGIILLDESKAIVGAYISCDLTLGSMHQGKGLGTELVIERALRDGEVPVVNLDRAAYSPAGLAAHKAAWRHARRNPREILTRLKRWQGGVYG